MSFYKPLFDDNPNPMWVLEWGSFRFLDVNRAALKVYGYSRREFLKMTAMDLRPKEDVASFLDVMKGASGRRGPVQGGIRRHRCKNGRILEVQVFFSPSVFQGRKVSIGVAIDVSAKRKAESALRESEDRWRAVAEGVPGFVTLLDRKGRMLWVNRLARGLKSEQVINRPIYEYMEPAGRAAAKAALDRVFKTGVPQRYVAAGYGDGGAIRWYESRLGLVGRERERVLSVAIDITDAHESELALREAERRWRSLATHMPGVVARLDARGRVLWINRFARGLSAGKLTGETVFSLRDAASRRALRRALRSAIRDGRSSRIDLSAGVSGEPRWYDVSIAPLPRADGTREAIAVASDITERQALTRARERLDLIFRHSRDAIGSADLKGRVLSANPALCRLTGYGVKELLRMRYDEFTAPEDRALDKSAVARLRRGQESVEYEKRYRRKDGSLVPVSMTVFGIRDDLGRLTGTAAVMRDISERQRLQQVQERFEAVFENCPDGLDYVSLDGTFQAVNPAFCRLTGYTRDELIAQKKFRDLTPPELGALDRWAVRQLVAGRDAVEFEKEYLRKDGRRVPIALTAYAIKGPDGRARAFGAIVKDVTERRRLEREILEAGAREQSKLGRDLHDVLGQTLTGLALLAKSARGRVAPEFEKSLGADLEKISELSSRAVQQSRALARGLIPQELHEQGLAEALSTLADNARQLFGLDCRVRLGEPVAVPAASAVQLYRLAQEALLNAVKHGGARRAEIRLRRASGAIRLEIDSDGKPFRLPGAGNRGLGLGIMRYRARMLGGSVEIRRGRAEGTVVSCRVPVASERQRAKSS